MATFLGSCFRIGVAAAGPGFVKELRKYVPRRAMINMYGELIMEEFREATSGPRHERNTVLKKIDVVNDKLNKARTAILYERIDPADFKIMKPECEKEIATLERQIAEISKDTKTVERSLRKVGQPDSIGSTL
jgi:hypothetical protein